MDDLEELCRIICQAEEVDPDIKMPGGMDVLMPSNKPYHLWEARKRVARAILEKGWVKTDPFSSQGFSLPMSHVYDCRRCLQELQESRPNEIIFSTMIVCPNCGNKRCPKATDHRLECTGSNEPGQPESIY